MQPMPGRSSVPSISTLSCFSGVYKQESDPRDSLSREVPTASVWLWNAQGKSTRTPTSRRGANTTAAAPPTTLTGGARTISRKRGGGGEPKHTPHLKHRRHTVRTVTARVETRRSKRNGRESVPMESWDALRVMRVEDSRHSRFVEKHRKTHEINRSKPQVDLGRLTECATNQAGVP